MLTIVLGIAASLLIVLAVAVYEGYIPNTFVASLTDTELGTLAALAIVGAAVCYIVDRK